jgi:murein DD-endopeptidase MepM/ murein hydrolase activator NlpD
VTEPYQTESPQTAPTVPGHPGVERRRSTSAAAPRSKRGRAGRAATYVAAAVAAAGAVYLTPSAPVQTRSLADLTSADRDLAPRPDAPFWHLRVDTLGRGESLGAILEQAGMSRASASIALGAVGKRDARALPAGTPITVRALSTDTLPAEITFQPEVDRIVHLRFLEGAWRKVEEKLAWKTDTVPARAVVGSSLYKAVHTALGDLLPKSERSELVYKLADIFEYRLDMTRDLQPGDEVKLLLERKVAPDGSPRDAQILAARVSVNGKAVDAVRFASGGGSSYFDQDGKSLRAAFLRTPVNFRRISSAFGGRWHPVLGLFRMHKGTDYAASSGTPVRSVGDGTVSFAGWKGGYGRVLEIRHRNGYVTRYGHLSRVAKGIRTGQSVGMGTTVAFVGSSGLATGPHLHFEVLVGGVQKDPRVALRDKAGWPISAGDRRKFQALRERLFASLDVAPPRDGRAQSALGE